MMHTAPSEPFNGNPRTAQRRSLFPAISALMLAQLCCLAADATDPAPTKPLPKGVATPGIWQELGDAGNRPGADAQVTRGRGQVHRIQGSTAPDFSELQDAYCIRIFDPGGFLATTDVSLHSTAAAEFDTRLFLFRSDGAPLLAADDVSGMSTASTLTGSAGDGSGFVLQQPGEYVLAIAGAADVPRDASNQDLFTFSVPTQIQGADPSAGRFDHWKGGTTAVGSYAIALEGAHFCQAELDGVFAEMGLGLETSKNQSCLGDGAGALDCFDATESWEGSFGVATGFFDRDRRLDVAVANISSQNQVCLGDGEGRTACTVIDDVGSGTKAVATGFFNSDQHVDVIFANGLNTGAVNRLCTGDGTGSFACGTVDAGAHRSQDVAVGFVDGDRHLDAVFANFGTTNRLCLGNGTGGFSCSTVSAATDDTISVVLGDLDGDGDLDAVFGNDQQRDKVCLGNGSGAFTCHDLNTNTLRSNGLALARLDGDAHLDVAIAVSLGRSQVCVGNGAGAFTCGDVESTGRQSEEVAVGLLDADSHMDLVFANVATPNRACFGDGQGAFTCNDINTAQGDSFGLTLGDLQPPIYFFADGFESGDTTAWSLVVP